MNKRCSNLCCFMPSIIQSYIIHNIHSNHMKKLKLPTYTSVTDAQWCTSLHTKLQELSMASLRSSSATPLTTQQGTSFAGRPTQSMHKPEMELQLGSVCCCLSLVKHFISSVEIDHAIGFSSIWAMFIHMDFVKSGHLQFICQTFLGPLAFPLPQEPKRSAKPRRTYKAESLASAGSDSSVHKNLGSERAVTRFFNLLVWELCEACLFSHPDIHLVPYLHLSVVCAIVCVCVCLCVGRVTRPYHIYTDIHRIHEYTHYVCEIAMTSAFKWSD